MSQPTFPGAAACAICGSDLIADRGWWLHATITADRHDVKPYPMGRPEQQMPGYWANVVQPELFEAVSA